MDCLKLPHSYELEVQNNCLFYCLHDLVSNALFHTIFLVVVASIQYVLLVENANVIL